MILLPLLLLAQSAAAPKPKPAAPPQRPTPLQEAATKARMAGRLDEAVVKYKQALQATPAWSEGWYFLGTIHYEKDRPRDCVESFARFVKLQPNVSAAYALMGLCFFQVKDYASALTALNHAERLGLPKEEQLTDVASYHAAMLYTRDGNFEKALLVLNFFSRRESIEPKIIELTGIAALRRPIFPDELPPADRELIFRVGRAVLTAGARRVADASKMFDDLVQDFPKAENLHFVYASLLLGADPVTALRQFEQELVLQPDHLPTIVIMGLEYLAQGKPEEAKAMGEKAVRIAPQNFTAHTLLGRALADGNIDLPAGIAELEKAVTLEPGSPQVRIALASAYAKAGRREDAAKQRAEFLRLKKQLAGGEATQ